MDRHFKVKAKESFIGNFGGEKIAIEKDKIYNAKEIIVTVNKSEHRRMGIYIFDHLRDSENYSQKFEKIED